jgi:ribonuclease P protein component
VRGPLGFPATARLRSRADFERLRKSGRRISRGSVLACWITSGNAPARLGITASRKAGGAVTRNQVKRWIREWFRKTRPTLPRGLSLVVVVRPGAAAAGHAALDRDLEGIGRTLGKAA